MLETIYQIYTTPASQKRVILWHAGPLLGNGFANKHVPKNYNKQ
jgi:hypothetical protein